MDIIYARLDDTMESQIKDYAHLESSARMPMFFEVRNAIFATIHLTCNYGIVLLHQAQAEYIDI